MPYHFDPLTESDARAILSWRYEGPYSFYNTPSEDMEEDVRYFLEPQNRYHAIRNDAGTLIGYCCFGEDAQVQGGDYQRAALDVGAGMNPVLTGQGRGYEFMVTILEFARHAFAPPRFRTTIAAWNQRALRMTERAGFRRDITFTRAAQGHYTACDFVILTKEESDV
ncbi:MAG: GNAT family N-acetyltransferase [Ardenticatenales bacterium]|nr:GNAT family N-acetyltransferase [Ardenticatenales bacterium]